jgi:xanthine/CO dehydrogenase XdhC/CoxF family maturation factor
MKEIRDIITAFDKAQSQGKQTALATVVHVEGSSYRKEGARMLITEDGELTGAISGGCLEGDALRKALFVMQEKKAKLVVYDTSDEDDVEIGFQLGCNGIIHVLIEPIDPDRKDNPVALLKEAVAKREYAVVATVFSLERNIIQIGTCFLLKQDGTIFQTNNDQHFNKLLEDDAQAVLSNHKSMIAKYELPDQKLTAFIHIIKPQVTLIVVGAGNDAIPLVNFGELLGWKVSVVDGRPDYANKKRFTSGCQVIVSKPEKIFSEITIDDQTVFVLMTHNYNYDLAMLRELMQRDVRYIGILGSRGKMAKMFDDLKSEGKLAEHRLPSVFGPVGLDIAAETPEEIALSVISEIQTVLFGGSGKHLRQHEKPIHPRKIDVKQNG